MVHITCCDVCVLGTHWNITDIKNVVCYLYYLLNWLPMEFFIFLTNPQKHVCHLTGF
uniref:Uncharacterized protein n=1 Tax=Rhizophora mucronata TaxID=61149 RepID=A0A2P2Q832_RHIMU